MSAETKQVLEMLKEGKISTEDAEKLLNRLSSPPASPPGATSSTSTPGVRQQAGSPSGPRKQQYLRIQVERPGHENVNMRIPLALARVSSWMALIPPRVSERLAEQGIDLSKFSELNAQELAEALENTNIDIDRGNGKKVRIFCE